MRSSNPDFDAVAAALRPEQLRTLRDYANARGTEELWAHATSRNVGVVLAG
jgi:hypothetical protein